MSNRREFLQDLATTTAGILFTGCGLADSAGGFQQSAGDGRRREILIGGRRVRTIDLHCHCYVPEVWDLVKDYDQAKPLQATLDSPEIKKMNVTNVTDRLRQMDEQGIDMQAVAMATTHFYPWAERDLASQIVKIQNEKIAELCAAHPERFVGMGTVAMQHPDLAAEQMENAVKKLDMRGIMINASVNGEELSAAKFHLFWSKAEELGTLIFLHPRGFPEGDRRFQGNGNLSNVIANPLDTTVALSHLIFEGTLDRFPGLKICAAHGGGYLASYIGRSDHCAEIDQKDCRPLKKRPSEYLKQLYFDSLVFSAENLRHLVAEVGAGRIVLGTDFPYVMGDTDAVNHVLSTPGLSDAQRESILGGTAARLLRIGV